MVTNQGKLHEKVKEAEETFFFAVHRVEKKPIFGNPVVSVNADGRKTVCDMVGWPLRERAACKGSEFSKWYAKPCKGFRIHPCYTSWLSSGFLQPIPHRTLGHTELCSVVMAHPSFGVGSTSLEIPFFFFSLAQKTQSSPSKAVLLCCLLTKRGCSQWS